MQRRREEPCVGREEEGRTSNHNAEEEEEGEKERVRRTNERTQKRRIVNLRRGKRGPFTTEREIIQHFHFFSCLE